MSGEATVTTEEKRAPELITIQELANRLGVARGTVYNHLGELDEADVVVRLNRKIVRIDWAKCLDGMRSGRIKFGAAEDIKL